MYLKDMFLTFYFHRDDSGVIVDKSVLPMNKLDFSSIQNLNTAGPITVDVGPLVCSGEKFMRNYFNLDHECIKKTLLKDKECVINYFGQ